MGCRQQTRRSKRFGPFCMVDDNDATRLNSARGLINGYKRTSKPPMGTCKHGLDIRIHKSIHPLLKRVLRSTDVNLNAPE